MIIAIDMDDTIENLLDAWLEELNKLYNTNYTNTDIKQWDLEHYFPDLTHFELTLPIHGEDFWYKVKPKEDAIVNVKKLIDAGHQVYIVTASSYKGLKSKMEDCLFKWFPYLKWSQVIIAEHKNLINCDVMIDDCERNLLTSSAKVKILFDTPHNKAIFNNDFIRTSDWNYIYELINSLGD